MRAEVPDWVALVALGLVMGSFLGVVVRRLPAQADFVFGRSQCPACGARLAARDLVPLASWLALRGRCRHCRARIGLFYPGIELAAVAVALSAATVASGWNLLATCLFGWTLLALALIDWREFLLPDALTLPLIPAGLALAWLDAPETILDRVAGVAAGFSLFWLIAAGYRRWRGRDGLGRGDIKLMAGLGAWVGASGVPSLMLAAALLALAVTLIRRAFGERLTAVDRIPFGPYLAAAAWVVWLCGPLIGS
ncbi:MAG: prepilin peptidase [Alphaproteobacteria bacterium]|nr:prepilin peptidase [Alphaproteobacteria bacterium]